MEVPLVKSEDSKSCSKAEEKENVDEDVSNLCLVTRKGVGKASSCMRISKELRSFHPLSVVLLVVRT